MDAVEAVACNFAASTALAELKSIVGDEHLLTVPAEMDGYLSDWTGAYHSDALAVARPANTDEVASVVKICAKNGWAVVPQGGNTGLCGGGVPIAGQASIVLSLARMNAVRSFDLAGRTVVAEAGVVLEVLHKKSLEHGLIFPLVFGAKGSCTLGGNLSTNAGGSNVVRYGNTRELCLGIEAVMPDGTIINALTGLRKDNTGYDLKNLLIGAEGTLGIITAAVFKLFPEPVTSITAFLSLSSLDVAVRVLNRLQDFSGNAVEAYEYMPSDLVELITRQFSTIQAPLDTSAETGILVELASCRATDGVLTDDGSTRLNEGIMNLLAELVEEGVILDAMIAQSEQQRTDLWHMRELVLEAITQNGPAYHFDLSLPLANIATFVEEMNDVAEELGFQPLIVGHLGDGNLHYALSAAGDLQWSDLPLEQAKSVAFELLVRLNGSFSAEHGIGQSKLAVMTQLKEASQLQVMRAIKTALDPQQVMNPGKYLPPINRSDL
ncbi:MAG: FAD-binding oxidoreductase [Granulosicoccus sp.]